MHRNKVKIKTKNNFFLKNALRWDNETASKVIQIIFSRYTERLYSILSHPYNILICLDANQPHPPPLYLHNHVFLLIIYDM